MAMSTIWYHDFCKIWIKKNWLKIGMMVFLKQKVKVMNFFIDTDGKINLWTSQCYSPWIPRYWGPSCQFFTIDLAIKISRHMNIVTTRYAVLFSYHCDCFYYDIPPNWFSKSYLSWWLGWCTLTLVASPMKSQIANGQTVEHMYEYKTCNVINTHLQMNIYLVFNKKK